MEKCLFDKWYYDGHGLSNFYRRLFDAFICGDGDNRLKIANAFPDQFRDSAFLKEIGLTISAGGGSDPATPK